MHLDTHYLGGGRYWGQWEIADLGVLVIFRRKRTILATKIALMQSKRLYPEETESSAEDQAIDYTVGFGRLFETEGEYQSAVKPRTFHFSPESRYRALESRGEQYEAILKYARDNSIPVHYLLYNPLDLPCSVALPADAKSSLDSADSRVGCRVISAGAIDTKLRAAKLAKSHNPSFAQVAGQDPSKLDSDFWTLQHFVADLVLGCKEGYIAETNPKEDKGLFRVFNGRSGPISAAISITIEAPGGAG